jgi:hypothetical protein
MKKRGEVEHKQISKAFRKIVDSRNLKCHLEKVSPSLLREITLFISNGNSYTV